VSRPQNGGRDRFEDYVPVAERIEKFYSKYPEGRITTEIVSHDMEGGFVLIKASAFRNPDDASPAATGHASEVRGESFVNKTSYIENGETSAVGRALAFLNFEVKRGIASREEVQRARGRESPPGREQPSQPQQHKSEATTAATAQTPAGVPLVSPADFKLAVPRDPQAKTPGDLIEPAKEKQIREIAARLGYDAEATCSWLMRAKLDDINRGAAMVLLKYFEALEEDGQLADG
jgi:hypothetical protein